VVGAGDLVDHPKEIAFHYLKGYFLIDLFVVFPLPQVNLRFQFPFLCILRYQLFSYDMLLLMKKADTMTESAATTVNC